VGGGALLRGGGGEGALLRGGGGEGALLRGGEGGVDDVAEMEVLSSAEVEVLSSVLWEDWRW
jgi:hypothetical protein|tara:strand:- start:89 stop:274 length:186 start_codon:yes stop_codon:yes gene_type:complete